MHLQLTGIDIRAVGPLDTAADRLTEDEARTAQYRTGAVGPNPSGHSRSASA
jgi:hypothetical protein